MIETAEEQTPIPEDAQQAFDEGTHAFIAGNNESAAKLFEKAVAGFEDFDEAYYLLGLTQLRQGLTTEAAASLEKAVAVTSNTMLRQFAEDKLKRSCRP